MHPIAAQRELVERIRRHWTDGSSGRRIPDRREALTLLRIVESIDEAVAALGGRDQVDLWVTAARDLGSSLSFSSARQMLEGEGKAVLVGEFGTGRWGLAPSGRCVRGRPSRAHPRTARRLQSPERSRGMRDRDGPAARRAIGAVTSARGRPEPST